MSGAGEDEAAARTAAASRACEDALKALRGIADPQQRMAAAGAFFRALRDYSDQAAGIRHDGAAEIRDAEKLTLAQLASRFGVSKQRAGQWVEAARKRDEEGGGGDE